MFETEAGLRWKAEVSLKAPQPCWLANMTSPPLHPHTHTHTYTQQQDPCARWARAERAVGGAGGGQVVSAGGGRGQHTHTHRAAGRQAGRQARLAHTA